VNERNEKIAAEVLAASKAAQTEVIVISGASALTRFANNTIHQNVAEEDVSVTVRAVDGKHVGVASGNDFSKPGLRRLAATALDIARQLPEIPDFPGLPGKAAVADALSYSKDTASMSPRARAKAAAQVIRPSASKGANASGTVSSDWAVLTAANSHGASATARRSEYEVTAVIEKGSGAGYAGGLSWDARKIDARRVGAAALAKCLSSAEPQPIEPASYTVILEPQAVAGLLSYIAYMGFGAQSFIEGRSFTSGRTGQKIMHESVSIWDDGLDPEGMPMPFDYEGQPRKRVNLIEKGVARGVVYDTWYGAKGGAASTGHALPPDFPEGPLPTNLFMAAGGSSLEEMIASTEKGILVTRFHYVNIADPSKAVLTGLTRDGTFLVENGRVAHPVRNLRFTESMLSAFSSVEALSRERSLESSMLGGVVAPAAKISSFRFTGATEF